MEKKIKEIFERHHREILEECEEFLDTEGVVLVMKLETDDIECQMR